MRARVCAFVEANGGHDVRGSIAGGGGLENIFEFQKYSETMYRKLFQHKWLKRFVSYALTAFNFDIFFLLTPNTSLRNDTKPNDVTVACACLRYSVGNSFF